MSVTPRRPKEIFEAIQSRDLEKVQQLLEDDEYVESLKGTPVPPPLVIAAMLNSAHLTQILIEKGRFDVNGINWSSATPLIEVAHRHGNTEIARQLIAAGADVNAKNDEGDTALIWACRNGYKELLKLLLEHGAEVDGQNAFGSTGLHEAVCTYASRGPANFKMQLLKYFGNDSETKTAEKSILELRELLEKQEVVLYLRDSEGRALYASGNKNIEMMGALLEAGANVNVRDAHGTTALLKATYTGCVNVVTFLLKRDASLVEGHSLLEGPSQAPGWKTSTWYPSPDVLKLYLKVASYPQYFQHLTDLFFQEILADGQAQVHTVEPGDFVLAMHIAGCPLSILLHAVKHINLQSSRQQELQTTLAELQASGPAPLLHLCRHTIRACLHSDVSTKLVLLELPKSLHTFLDLPELDAILADRPNIRNVLDKIFPATSV